MRKRCVRRRYHAGFHPVRLAMLAGAENTDADLASLRTIEFLSLAAWEAGKATAADRGTLRRVCATCAELARAGFGPEALQLVDAALAAVACESPDPAGAAVLRELLGLYDRQRLMAGAADFERAVHRAVWGKPK